MLIIFLFLPLLAFLTSNAHTHTHSLPVSIALPLLLQYTFSDWNQFYHKLFKIYREYTDNPSVLPFELVVVIIFVFSTYRWFLFGHFFFSLSMSFFPSHVNAPMAYIHRFDESQLIVLEKIYLVFSISHSVIFNVLVCNGFYFSRYREASQNEFFQENFNIFEWFWFFLLCMIFFSSKYADIHCTKSVSHSWNKRSNAMDIIWNECFNSNYKI